MAHEDWDKAVRRVAEAAKSKATSLDLNGLKIDSFPPEISRLTQLSRLSLNNTDIADLTPLSGLTELVLLDLNHTWVFDLSPLAKLKELTAIYLRSTQVSDVSPLAQLHKLDFITLNESPVADLRPFLNLPMLNAPNGDGKARGIWFGTIPACTDPAIAAASDIEDSEERLKTLFAHLRTLPPWPVPLATAEVRGLAAVQTPGNKPAPLMVRVDPQGMLISDPPSRNLEDAQDKRAKEAWDALQNYLADLGALKTKIDNAMPNLGRAFDSFKRAMGPEFEAMNAIELGMQADRIQRLAMDADSYLMGQDPTELEAFTAALALYMRRFNRWEQYKDDPAPLPQTITDLRADREVLTQLHKDLATEENVAEAVEKTLADLTDAGTSETSTALEARALLDSESNVLDQLAERSLAEQKVIEDTDPELLDHLYNEAGQVFRSKLMDNVPVSGGVWAFAFLFRNRGPINQLAQRYPDHFGFMTAVLRHLFG